MHTSSAPPFDPRPFGAHFHGAEAERFQRIGTIAYTLLVGLCGAAWVHAVGAVELSNLVAILLVAGSALVTGRSVRLPTIHICLLIAVVWLYFALSFRSGGGQEHAIRSLAYILMAIALAQYPMPDLRTAARLGTVILLGLVLLSASLTGSDLVAGTIDYLTSLNRGVFVYQVIRPMLNAFATGDANYLASVINTLASALAILFVIAATHRAYVAALICGLCVFVLFSAAALLAVVLTLAVLGTRWIARSPRKLGPFLALIALIISVPLVIEPAMAYLSTNLLNDNVSRAARLDQYAGALDYINSGLVFGEGLVFIGGHLIHNAFLFTWVSAGVVPALFMGAAYVLALAMLARAVPAAIFGDIRWCAVFGLTAIFLIRISIGGGGGLPDSTGTAALAVAICLARHLRQDVGGQHWPQSA